MRANEFFKSASSVYGKTVINPTDAGYFTSIQQREMLALWRRFIRKYVSVMLMNDGWEYSSGCVEEFYLALKEGVDIYSHDFKRMDRGKLKVPPTNALCRTSNIDRP